MSTLTVGQRRDIRDLLVQAGIIVAAFGVLIWWLLTTDLTEVESSTLAPGAVWSLTVEHLLLTVISAVIVLAVAIPLGILLTRPALRRAAGPVMAVANIGQAAPAVGIIVLFGFWLGFGLQAAIAALVVYALLPVLRNTMVGLTQVDRQLIEAGRGMGMSAAAVLFRVELPLAVPVMLSGIRTALVLLVGTATLATFVNGGGLGLLITTGVTLDLTRVLIAGAILVALLALVVDWTGRVVELAVRPKGLA
ncbi:ABC transporter permease [Brevibacterium luteolum]|uniref:ABC transporter permease n=1 Tax=Brevibacterium luteolum TaxID=199591 RepID=A0A849ATS7_9MICO|nr:ABC transporter permease [Brevibacterium luteolum]MBM7530349.1 osmoprotectant transport system permease protein [Brevibacterium luteolum]MCT1873347.1 ABC transporter permease [Brevibacterium luteolum]MCT1890003.1 ABC transporter permease [Brevibacterium luteolum]MCT1892552.1 ABC transporter permease [Brevibacterium luteolum]MCT1923093.1 ABC transporter permease [Brevibacterium luteolum]